MQHQHEIAVLLQREGHSFGRDVRRVPRRPVEEVPVRRHRRVSDQSFVAWFGIVLVEVPRRAGRIELHRRVVHDARISGSQLPRFDKARRGDRHRNDEVPIDVVARGAKRVRPGHGDDDVRLAKVPRADCRRRRRRGGRVAFTSAVRDPPLNQRDLLVAQSSRAHEFAVTRFRLPGRHVPARGRGGDLFGAAFCVRIAQEAEGCRSARAMARRAMREHDRRDVRGEGDGARRGRGSLTGTQLDRRRRRGGGGQPPRRKNQVHGRHSGALRRHESIFGPPRGVSRHFSFTIDAP